VIVNILKNYYLFCLIAISCFTSFAYQATPTVELKIASPYDQSSNCHIRHGIRTTSNTPSSYSPASCYAAYNKGSYASLLPADFQHAFQDVSNNEILNNYPLYAFPNFLKFARTLPCYESHILSLYDKIQYDKAFKKQTACMPYFDYSFFLWYENSGFHKFVAAEAQSVIKTLQQPVSTAVEKQGTLHVNDYQNLDMLAHRCTQKINTMPQGNTSERLTERINAIDETCNTNGKCFDYSLQVPHLSANDPDIVAFQDKHGTQLDCQLHKELCQTRNTMRNLEHSYSNDPHVQILAPVVYRYTLQAKNEKCPLVAFELSDFCHTITHVLSNSMNVLYDASSAVGKGVWKGANDFASIEHWKGMVTGAAQLGLLFADAVGQEDALHYAVVLAATSNDSNAVVAAAEKYCEHTQGQKDVINLCAQETYKKIKAMSWQEIVEHGTEIGTTMILDTLALNAVNGFSRTASNLAINQLNSAMEKGVLFTEQYAVEVACFGKLIVEEGAEVAGSAIEAIKKDLIVLHQKNDSIIKIIQEMKEAGTILKPIENNVWKSPAGLIYKADKKFGNRINHVLAHAKSNPLKNQHSIFNITENKILGLIDEAWAMKGNPLESDIAAYIIDMKRKIGLNGESAIKIVVIPGTSEILTAYPVNL